MTLQQSGSCSVLILLAGALFGIRDAIPASAVFIPSADTTLIAAAPENNLGGSSFFNTGVTGTGFPNHGLFRFDFTSQIPLRALVQSLTLELTVVFTPPASLRSDSLFGLHRVLRAWGEGLQVPENPFSPGLGAAADPGEATWTHRFAGGPDTWSIPGGEPGVDYAAEGSNYIFISGIDTYRLDTTPSMMQDVQFWVDNPDLNHGWMLVPTSLEDRYSARRFGSRENPGSAPTLTIEFEVVPEPSSVMLLLVAGAGFVGLGIRIRRVGRA